MKSERGPARRLRLEDVAAEVGVSPSTVSLVLRGAPGPSAATRKLVQQAAARLGYRPDRAASALASQRSKLIGVVLDVSNTFHAQLVEDVHDAADRFDYDLVLSTVTRDRDEPRAIETLLDSRCAALILLGPKAPIEHLAAVDQQLPVVVVGRPVPSAGVDVVRAADDEGVGQLVGHLAGLGHRRIAYVDGGPGPIATLRRRGYRNAMCHSGLSDTVEVIEGGDTEVHGCRAAQTVLASAARPTAVLAFNDRCATGLLDALVRAGVRTPGEISVAGYDDSPIARLAHIDLTSVSQSPRELTEHAIAALLERLDRGRTAHREVVVAPRLIVRRTTGPPPN